MITLRHEVFKRITTWHMKLNGNIMKFSSWECLFPESPRCFHADIITVFKPRVIPVMLGCVCMKTIFIFTPLFKLMEFLQANFIPSVGFEAGSLIAAHSFKLIGKSTVDFSKGVRLMKQIYFAK